jgi:hypothetical protein
MTFDFWEIRQHWESAKQIILRTTILVVNDVILYRGVIYVKCYTPLMLDDSRREQITVRVIRDGAPEPRDDDWAMASPEERMEAVWMLTELCLAWQKSSASVPRLQRTITRLQRAPNVE